MTTDIYTVKPRRSDITLMVVACLFGLAALFHFGFSVVAVHGVQGLIDFSAREVGLIWCFLFAVLVLIRQIWSMLLYKWDGTILTTVNFWTGRQQGKQNLKDLERISFRWNGQFARFHFSNGQHIDINLSYIGARHLVQKVTELVQDKKIV